MTKNKIIRVISLLAVIMIFTSCAQKFNHLEKKEIITSLDFTKYQENGFLITPGGYGENYTSLGIFTFTIYAEANYIEQKKDDGTITGKWKSEILDSQDILDLAYKTALEKGANAITHFKIKSYTTLEYDGRRNFGRDTLEISGLLIKRELNL